MSREEFINNIWKPYPAILSERNDFFYGRVDQLDDKTLVIKNQRSQETFEVYAKEVVDKELGISISLDHLIEGDVVVYSTIEQVVFLLSPALE